MTYVNAADLTTAISERLRDLGLHVAPGPTADPDQLTVVLPTQFGDEEVVVHVVPHDGLAREAQSLQDRRPGSSIMIAQRHIAGRLGAAYRSWKLPYVDSGGNMWLDLRGSFIHIEGRRPTIAATSAAAKSARAFTPAGLRVTFVLLISDALRDAPLRGIAVAAGVSLGATQAALSDLVDQGLLLEGASKRRMFDIPGLTERWLAGYPTRLRPKVHEERLVGPEPSFWLQQIPQLAEIGVALGGEAGMAALGYPIRPTTTLLYGDRPFGGAKKLGRLKQGAHPTVQLRQRFWTADAWPAHSVTPPLLVYADAMGSGDARQFEIAREMWNQDDELRRLHDSR